MCLLTHAKKCVYVIMISDRPAGRPIVCSKIFNVAIFSDTINMINVKLCMIVALI